MRINVRRGCITVVATAALIVFTVPHTLEAQGPTGPVGPPTGLAVNVVGGAVQVSGGSVNVAGTVTVAGGTVATTQSGTWTVQVTQELYSHTTAPTCDAGNRCFVLFPEVPAGKSLRVSRIYGSFATAADGFVALRADAISGSATRMFSFPVTHIAAAFEGNVLSFNQDTDVVFTEGQQPVVVVGTDAFGPGLPINPNNRLGITGTLVPTP